VALSAQVAGHSHDDLLLSREEDRRCEEFLRSAIRTKVFADWSAATAGGEEALVEDWLRLASKYEPPMEVCARWRAMAAAQEEREGAESAVREEKEQTRIARNIHFFRSRYLTREGEPFAEPQAASTGSLREEVARLLQTYPGQFEDPALQRKQRLRIMRDKSALSAKIFLPDRLATELVRSIPTLLLLLPIYLT
jgi:hypothetical protein